MGINFSGIGPQLFQNCPSALPSLEFSIYEYTRTIEVRLSVLPSLLNIETKIKLVAYHPMHIFDWLQNNVFFKTASLTGYLISVHHNFRHNVVGAGSGRSHSVVVTEDGLSFAFGWNKHGQLGSGSLKNGEICCLIYVRY